MSSPDIMLCDDPKVYVLEHNSSGLKILSMLEVAPSDFYQSLCFSYLSKSDV